MKNMLRLAAFGLAFVLAGCVTTGGKAFDPTAAQSFQEGKTTQADVLAKLGQPQIKTVGEEGPGTSTWTYASGSAKPDAKNYIPIVGPLLNSHPTSSQQSLVLNFDSRGVLQHLSQRESNF